MSIARTAGVTTFIATVNVSENRATAAILNGTCGTGAGYCGIDVCHSRNCTGASVAPTLPPWLRGNTTDGTCGEASSCTCNVVYGHCCNKDGLCGPLPSACGVGW